MPNLLFPCKFADIQILEERKSFIYTIYIALHMKLCQIYGSLFPQQNKIKIKKGNWNFLPHNSDFFIGREFNLYLGILMKKRSNSVFFCNYRIYILQF